MHDYSTKAGREAAAKRLEDIATAKGANFKPHYDSDSVSVTLERDGVTVTVFLLGRRAAGQHLGHWTSKRELCPTFGADVGGPVNPHHGCKATTFADTFDTLLHRIERGLELVERGEAFAEPEA